MCDHKFFLFFYFFEKVCDHKFGNDKSLTPLVEKDNFVVEFKFYKFSIYIYIYIMSIRILRKTPTQYSHPLIISIQINFTISLKSYSLNTLCYTNKKKNKQS